MPKTDVFILVIAAVIVDLSRGHDDGLVLCRECGRTTTEAATLLNNVDVSPFDTHGQNSSFLFGVANVPVQKLKNPDGFEFDVVLFRKAGCSGSGKWVAKDSWFPGFAWRICVCPKCGQQLGWIFDIVDKDDDDERPLSESSFYGLVLDRVIDENVTPTILNYNL